MPCSSTRSRGSAHDRPQPPAIRRAQGRAARERVPALGHLRDAWCGGVSDGRRDRARAALKGEGTMGVENFPPPIDVSLRNIRAKLVEFQEVAAEKLAELEHLSDGRNRRSADSKRAILAAARELMIGGVWRPSMAETCELARRSLRTGFEHFSTLGALHREALQDGVVRDHIAMRAVGSGWELLPSAMRDRIV